MFENYTIFVCLSLFLYFLKTASAGDEDLHGVYCGREPTKCCMGRQDECSVPILDTLCYCDDFCDRIRKKDCCPDFWSICKSSKPPDNLSRCIEGQTIKINCNSCKCQKINNTNRTEMLCESNICLVEEDILNQFNDIEKHGWKASNYSEYWGRKYDESVVHRLGTFKNHKEMSSRLPINPFFDPESLPRNFDARVKWKGMISEPKDQGWCGASWVFSTVAVASDRFAIASNGSNKQLLSAQHLFSCSCNQQGCEGGYLTKAWTFILIFGLVPETCYSWTGNQTKCDIEDTRYSANTRCPTSGELVDLRRIEPAYRRKGERNIMYEIMTSGPVQATMKISREFFSYSNGIYSCSRQYSSHRSDYHSVRIVGWGEENKYNRIVKYWIVSNSWGEWWGEKGYFRIQRGTNECQIEDFVISARATTVNITAISKHKKRKYKYPNSGNCN